MKSNKILADVIHHMKYAKYIPELKRRESFDETCLRNMDMHIEKYPFLGEQIEQVYNRSVLTKKVLPAMRSMQFAGDAIKQNNVRMFNCSYAPCDSMKIFSESMFLLLSGVGFGYSVQFHHVLKLPSINAPRGVKTYKVSDSIEGWADAIHELIKAFLDNKILPDYDFSGIRKKGSKLSSGGKAPGYYPLKNCLDHIKNLFLKKLENNDFRLSTLDCHSIFCFIADAVLAGGIRRAAMIALFSFDDLDMRGCKSGQWWLTSPHFARANNSAIAPYQEITESMFKKFWQDVEKSGAGEPGYIPTHNKEYGVNPCVEACLRAYSFCNLVEINGSGIKDQQDFNQTCADAAFINTLQASYTDFHYLRDIWKQTTDEDALIGVSITGIASGCLDNLDLELGSEIIKKTNEEVAKLIGINKAARCTLVKPAGTTSLILGTSSGIHDWHDKFYLRRVRVNKQEAIYSYILENLPEIVENDNFDQHTAIFVFPQKAPDNAKIRSNTDVIELLERVKKYNLEWIRNGHNRGDNYHNVSATISIKGHEWEKVGSWIWNNRYNYHGLSVLPFDGGTYQQAPFESCDENTYNQYLSYFKDIDLKQIIEIEDNTEFDDSIACSGGTCELI